MDPDANGGRNSRVKKENKIMKKLMFVAAAMAAGLSFADVTSANVVGYANDTLTSTQWKPVCSQFLKIGSKDGSDMKLGELIPGGGWTYGSDSIKVLTKAATLDFDAVYLPEWASLTKAQQRAATSAGRTEGNWEAGWYVYTTKPDYTACKNDYPLPFGTCILVYSTTTGAYITSNGEVVQPEDQQIVTKLVSTEWKFVGNCTPVARTLKDFVPGNGWAYGSDSIKILTKAATLDFDAVYLPEWASLTKAQQRAATSAGRAEGNWEAGWYVYTTKPDYTACKNDYPIVAGAGFLAYSTTTGATITQPSAL